MSSNNQRLFQKISKVKVKTVLLTTIIITKVKKNEITIIVQQ